ncbi:MAG: hypothetical protein ACTSVI_06045 [Promethearchaeota archaeon]
MKKIFENLVSFDNEGKKIVMDAKNRADQLINSVKKEVEEKISSAKNTAIQKEESLIKENSQKLTKFEKEFQEKLHLEIERLNNIVKKNWNNALTEGMKLFESI